MAKFLKLENGRIKEEVPIVASTGAADGGKMVQTDASGRVDPTLMPVGIGADVVKIMSAETLSSGDFVNVFNDNGVASVRAADASAVGKEVDGFVLDSFSAGAMADVYFEGRNTALTGLTIGARYYLSDSDPGTVTTTPPTGSGRVVQYIGRATDANSVGFEATDGVILA
jgi:hypothetical protein